MSWLLASRSPRPKNLSSGRAPYAIVRAVLRALSVPAGNERGPQYMDQALTAFHQANNRRLEIKLELRRHAGEVTLACHFPEELRAVIEGQLYAQYPDCRISAVTEPNDNNELRAWALDLHLRRALFPIKRYTQFEDALNRVSADPLTALLSTLAQGKAEPSLDPRIEIVIQPASRRIRRRADRALHRLAAPFFRDHDRLSHVYAELAMSPHATMRLLAWCIGRMVSHQSYHSSGLTTTPGRQHDREEDLQAAADKLGRLLFSVHVRLSVTGRPDAGRAAMAKLREMAGAFGQFSAARLASFHAAKPGLWHRKRTFLLSTEELATLWHLPTLTVRAATMTAVESREAEPPVRLPTAKDHPDLAIVGQAVFRNKRQTCGLLPDDRRRHLLIEGKTGMGKSTLLHRLIATDIAAGRGVGLIDPHGDLCESILASVPSARTNDVVLFDMADTAHPLAFNILHCPRAEQRALAVSGIIAAFKKIWGDFFGPRMEHILRNTLLTLLEVPGATLLSVNRMLGDARFRDSIVAKVSDPVVRSFWLNEFAPMPAKLQAEAVSPIYNKVGQLISNPLLRNIFGQSRSTIDLRRVMDEGKVLLVNLSKGRIGEDASALLGALLVTAIQQAAMSRADTREQDRPDFHLFIDEFQNFATEAFATILSEARKYRLSLTVANQYLDQIDDATRSAVFGNIGSMIVFAVGVQDAEVLAEQLGGDLTTRDLIQLPRYQAYARLLIDGHPSRPFSLRTLPPMAPAPGNERRPGIIRRYCRQRYGRAVEMVENEVARAFA